MSDSAGPTSFEDINRAVMEEWKAETTPYERIRAVISRSYTPIDAETVAERAGTAPKTARKHLTTLADDGFVTTETGDTGATLYRRSAESLVVEQTADILSELSTEELRSQIAEMRDTITEFQQEYGVESPDELAVDRTNELLAGSEASDRDRRDVVREWQTTRRNLAFANAALSIATARTFVEDDAQPHDETGTP
jgi:predicted ArsR family transcriptional regulator